MKNRKSARSLGCCLTLCLLCQNGPAAAYGSEMTAGTQPSGMVIGEVELNPEDGSTQAYVEMNANITASLISVSLPADGFDFTVDPAQTFDISTPAAQITSPDVTVANHSVVPVKLEISVVPEVGKDDVKFSEKFSDYAEQSFRLVDTISGVGPPGTAILVLGTQDRQYGSLEEFEHYAICPGRTGIFVAEIPAEEETVIKLYGKVAPDFYGEYEFTVRPTLKISTVRANESADSYKK